MSGSIRIGTIFGIPIKINYTWLFIFALLTLSLGFYYFPQRYSDWPTWQHWGVALATTLLFFASVLVHELMHSLISIAQGVPVRDITLFIFGGVSSLTEEPRSAGSEFVMALAGPLSSIVLAAIFGLTWLVTRYFAPPLAAMCFYLAGINLSLGFFNLIPGFPLDGGRVLRAILWAATGNIRQATTVATQVGRLIAALFIIGGLGLVFLGQTANGLWLAFIGWFLDNAAQQSYRQMLLSEMLRGVSARDIMTTECAQVYPGLLVENLVHDYLLAQGKRCFVVIQNGNFLGIVTVHNVKAVPRERWSALTAQDIMTPLALLKRVAPQDEAIDVLRRMDEADVNQMPVIEGDRLIGLVGRDQVLHLIRMRAELGI